MKPCLGCGKETSALYCGRCSIERVNKKENDTLKNQGVYFTAHRKLMRESNSIDATVLNDYYRENNSFKCPHCKQTEVVRIEDLPGSTIHICGYCRKKTRVS